MASATCKAAAKECCSSAEFQKGIDRGSLNDAPRLKCGSTARFGKVATKVKAEGPIIMKAWASQTP